MFMSVVLALALAHPGEVFEDWSLLDTSPLRESLTVRARYARRDGPEALLPAAVQGPEPPVVYIFGRTEPLRVQHSTLGWTVPLPPGDRPTVRITAHVVRQTVSPRLFSLRWPALAMQSVPVRRVATIPRAWLQGVPTGWTCPDEPTDDVPCVSTLSRPPPLPLRVPPPVPPRGTYAIGFALVALALGIVTSRPEARAERVLSSVGGGAVAVAVALALVGARWTSWPVALSCTVPVGIVLGSFAIANRTARVVGSVTLLLIPLLAVLDGRAGHVAITAIIATVASVLARRRDILPRPTGAECAP